MKTKQAFLIQPKKFEIKEIDITPQPNQILVKVAACGLCSWELNHWKGIIGSYPRTLGHEWAGEVVDIGANAKKFNKGDFVTMFPYWGMKHYGFSEYAVVDEQYCLKLAKDIDLKYAIGEPLKCVVTVLRSSPSEAGDNGVISGCGPMGLWCIQGLSGNLLSSLIAVDIDERKLKLAKDFGATHIINAKEEDARERIKEITDGHMADFVIDGTGIPSMLNAGVSYLKDTGRGRLIIMSSHETTCKEFDFREAMSRSVQIIVAQHTYSQNEFDDFRRAVALINNGIFKVKQIVSHEFPLEKIQEAFEILEQKPASYIKGIVVP